MLRPSIALDFSDVSYVDPRLTFTRASPGSYSDRLGVLRYRPPGAARFWHNSSDGSPLGMMLENADTNLLLWSEDFTNAAWTNTTCTVTPNASLAPDGNLTADTVAAGDSTSSIAQASAITVNNNVSLTLFARAGATNFVSLSAFDGKNAVSAWFNLSNGTVGSTLLGAGTLKYQTATIQRWNNGWYRCGLQAITNGNTTITAAFSPCAADASTPVAGASINAWGMMLAQEGINPNTQRNGSYIGTSGAAATRAVDGCYLPYSRIEPNQFNPNEGTFFTDFAVPYGAWQDYWDYGFGAVTDVNNRITTGLLIGQGGIGKMTLAVQSNIIVGGASAANAWDYPPFTFETPVKIASRYSRTKTVGLCVNGRQLVSSPTIPNAMPPLLPVSFSFNLFQGTAAYNATTALLIRRFLYFPRYLSVDQMQQLTA